MDERHLDATKKVTEIRALIGGDISALRQAIANAELALEFRAADEMIGLSPVEPASLDALREATGEARRSLIDRGDVDTAIEVARRGIRGLEDDATIEKAAALLAAEEGSAEAIHQLALLSFHGVGRPEDKVRCYELQQRAAGMGHAGALFELYAMTAQGLGCDQDMDRAVAYCIEAAEAGNVRAMANVAGFFATGNGVVRDVEQSLAWYGRAAEHGHGRAATVLGIMYANGDDLPASAADARRWFDRAEALAFPWKDLALDCGVDLAALGYDDPDC